MVRSSETNLFNSGIRPAVNPGISVSRVGGAAQTKIIKKLSGGIRTALAQYRELAAFSQFASDLDEATRKQLSHGQKVTELLKQKQYAPMSVAQRGWYCSRLNAVTSKMWNWRKSVASKPLCWLTSTVITLR